MKGQNRRSRQLRSGSYSAVITVAVIAFIVVINLVVNALPADMTKFDFTQQQLYTLSDQTKKLVEGLSQDITIYAVAQQDNEDSGLKSVLEKYQALSPNIRVEYKDPAVYPTFTAQYTDETLADNSVIVESGQRSRVIPVADMYEVTYDSSTGEAQATGFVGEDCITSAIDYVTTDKLPKLYVINGHGEQSLGNFTSEIQRENIMTENLALATEQSIPSDAAALLMEAPTSDISENEKNALLEYLDDGGSLFYVSNVLKGDTPNLDAVLAVYGIQITKGFVCEGEGGYYQNPSYIIPKYGTHAIVEPLSDSSSVMLAAVAQNIEIRDDKPSDVKVTPLLRTSSSAYNKAVDANTDMSSVNINKEDGDKTGVMNLSVIAEKGDTQVVVATTYDLFSSQTNQQVSGGNYDFLLNVFGTLCEHDSMVSIRGKQLYAETLTVTSGHTMIWIFALMIFVPVVCLVAGLVLWVRRRKR